MDWIQEHLTNRWVLAAIVLAATVVAARVLKLVVAPVLGWLARRSRWSWDDLLAARIASPLSSLLAVQLLQQALPWVELGKQQRALIAALITVMTTVLVLWAGFRAVDVAVSVIISRSWAAGRPATRSLIAITGRFTKVVIVLVSAIAVLAHLGVSVTSLVAGVGVGGLALALAAQKTVENLFGTLSIGVDQPFRETDFIKVGEVLGTVEAIGLRSTRIRTLDRTLITIPNGKLADMSVESYTVRDRFRLFVTLPLVLGTPSAKMRAVLQGIEAALRAHPQIWPDDVVVRFKELGASSMNIEIMAWFLAESFSAFQLIRQDMLLAILEAVEANGARLALPTQTLHVAGGALPGVTDGEQAVAAGAAGAAGAAAASTLAAEGKSS